METVAILSVNASDSILANFLAKNVGVNRKLGLGYRTSKRIAPNSRQSLAIVIDLGTTGHYDNIINVRFKAMV
jgi:hypothetical protein